MKGKVVITMALNSYFTTKKIIRRARRASLKRYNAARSAFGYCPKFTKRVRQYDKAWRYCYIKNMPTL